MSWEQLNILSLIDAFTRAHIVLYFSFFRGLDRCFQIAIWDGIILIIIDFRVLRIFFEYVAGYPDFKK